MIKFFRNIRQQHLNQGEMKKYTLYAIGEILLVVVGILIALQINNWNENRISKKTEKIILQRLSQDLEKDQERFQLLDSVYQDKLQKNIHFRKLIRKTSFTDDDLMEVINFWGANARDINPRLTTYEEMVNSGKIYDLTNESLVNQICEYYRKMARYESTTNKEDNEYAVVWNGRDLINFWHMKNVREDKSRARKLGDELLNKDGEDYKHLTNIVGWGIAMTGRNKNRINELSDLNSDLRKNINSYLLKK